MGQETLFSVDSLLILRGFAGLLFGFAYAAGLTFTDVGRHLAKDVTWFSVVLGVGGVMVISWPADWYTIAVVFCTASVGIIIRSLVLDSRGAGRSDGIYRSHKTKNGIDDATARIIKAWGLALTGAESSPPQEAMVFNQMLTHLEIARSHLSAARKGEDFSMPAEAKRAMRS